MPTLNYFDARVSLLSYKYDQIISFGNVKIVYKNLTSVRSNILNQTIPWAEIFTPGKQA